MPDRKNGPGDERYSSSRYARPPDGEWAPETEQQREHGTEGLRPGTEGMAGRDPGTAGREPGTAGPGRDLGTARRDPAGTAGREPGMAGPGRDPGMAGRDPETAGREAGMGGYDPEMAGREPGMAGRDPEMAGREPGMAGRDPEMAGREPGMAGSGQEPGMAGYDPETAGREPGMAGYDPEMAGREASMTGRGEPGLGTPAAAPDAARMPDDGLGAPSPGDLSGREARTTEGTAPDAWPATAGDGAAGASSEAAAPLLPHEETERWEERIRQLAAGFVDRPRAAVEEADRALEEIAARFGEAVTRRRRSLRMSWENGEEQSAGNETDTEQLRLAMRDYRDLAERLLHG
ncbi:hypothetical protein [Streptomyces sp. NPDC091383]|uniref:hypothetical protein n=1 Tax=Streptomyces sp. NPDC091383 TaxID=3365996 RepID=UPI0037F8D86A